MTGIKNTLFGSLDLSSWYPCVGICKAPIGSGVYDLVTARSDKYSCSHKVLSLFNNDSAMHAFAF